MSRHRHAKPKRDVEISQIEKAEAVKRELQADGFKVQEVQFWKKKKLSDALRKLIQPYEHEADSYDSYYSLVGFASVAWNSSLVEEPERSKLIEDFLKTILKRGAPREAKVELRNFIEELIKRKLKLFPNDTRFIAKFELENQGDDFYLSVASVMPSEEK